MTATLTDRLAPLPSLASLDELIAEGIRAFREDPCYLIQMARHSSIVSLKRGQWVSRT